MQAMLGTFGECRSVFDGGGAVAVFQSELDKGEPFDLVCLDIMMPGMSGQEVLTAIRGIEKKRTDLLPKTAKIIMTSTLNDRKNILVAYTNQCDVYLVKPVEYQQLVAQIRLLGLIRA